MTLKNSEMHKRLIKGNRVSFFFLIKKGKKIKMINSICMYRSKYVKSLLILPNVVPGHEDYVQY